MKEFMGKMFKQVDEYEVWYVLLVVFKFVLEIIVVLESFDVLFELVIGDFDGFEDEVFKGCIMEDVIDEIGFVFLLYKCEDLQEVVVVEEIICVWFVE